MTLANTHQCTKTRTPPKEFTNTYRKTLCVRLSPCINLNESIGFWAQSASSMLLILIQLLPFSVSMVEHPKYATLKAAKHSNYWNKLTQMSKYIWRISFTPFFPNRGFSVAFVGNNCFGKMCPTHLIASSVAFWIFNFVACVFFLLSLKFQWIFQLIGKKLEMLRRDSIKIVPFHHSLTFGSDFFKSK